MRVLIVKRVGAAYGYVTDGFVNALRTVGCAVQRWDGAIETWEQFNPDLYIGCAAHPQEPPKGHRAALALHVNPLGPVTIPDIMESAKNVAWVCKVKPTVVYGYGFDDDYIYWSHWQEKHGINWVGMSTACDATIFKDLKASKTLDVVYLGGYWPYKAQSIEPFLFPILNNPRIKSKVMGWGQWPERYEVQPCPETEGNAFLNSGVIGPCISEPHTHQWGIDVPERVFKVAAIGLLPIIDSVPTLKRKLLGVPMASTGEEMVELAVHYLDNPSERIALANALQKNVLSQHTYHHRMANLLINIAKADNRYSSFLTVADKLNGYSHQ